MRNIPRMKFDSDVTSSIRGLITKTSELKMSIFKSLLYGTPANSYTAHGYLSYVRGFLDQWEAYASDISERLKTAGDPPANVHTIGYNFVKDYIFDKYDYNAMVSFTDALAQGIKDGKFNNKDDIDQFFKFTVCKAFGDHDAPASVAELLDSVLTSNIPMIESDIANDRRMFNAIKTKKDIFDSRDKINLYNSTQKVVNFVSDKNLVNKVIPSGINTSGLYVSAINSIMEFVVYSLSAYAIRIYAISKFMIPYINAIVTTTITATESADMLQTTNHDDNNPSITIMRDADDASCKSFDNYHNIIDTFVRMGTAIGANGLYNDRIKSGMSMENSYISLLDLTSNSFAQKLFSNDLYAFMSSEIYINSMNDLYSLEASLDSLVHSSSTNVSSKNAFAIIVRDTICDDTAQGYRKLFADLLGLTAATISSLHRIVSIITYFTTDNRFVNQMNDANITRISRGLTNTIRELYSDLMFLYLQKARWIETKYNSIASNVNELVGLNLDKIVMKDCNTTSDITNAVPDTTKAPIDLSDLYALPAFEYYQFYDEAVKVAYNLHDNEYYSEAFNLNEVVNAIKAFLQARLKIIQNWWSNAQRQQALKWATEHGDAVIKGDFTNQTMEVLPFKTNGSKEDIDLGSIVGKLINGLNSFKIDIVDSQESVNNYIKSLYPEPTVYEWFNDAKQKGEAEAKFHSYLLFRELNNVSTQAEPSVKISGNEINKRCAWWVDTCKNGQSVYNNLIKLNNQLIQAQNKIQQGVVGIMNSAKNSTTTEPLSSPSGTDAKQTKDTQDSTATEKATNVNLLLSGIQSAIHRIYEPMTRICMEYIDTEYRYLKQAYTLSTASQSTNQNELK